MNSEAGMDVQKVVIVNGGTEVLDLLETGLGAGRYDMVFVESRRHAYSHIKRVQPNLVILRVRLDDPDDFQVMSMLKLDKETRAIPILTYTTEDNGQESKDEVAGPSENELFARKAPAAWMN